MNISSLIKFYSALRSAGGGGQNVISRQWENGKPVGDFNWGAKPKTD